MQLPLTLNQLVGQLESREKNALDTVAPADSVPFLFKSKTADEARICMGNAHMSATNFSTACLGADAHGVVGRCGRRELPLQSGVTQGSQFDDVVHHDNNIQYIKTTSECLLTPSQISKSKEKDEAESAMNL